MNLETSHGNSPNETPGRCQGAGACPQLVAELRGAVHELVEVVPQRRPREVVQVLPHDQELLDDLRGTSGTQIGALMREAAAAEER